MKTAAWSFISALVTLAPSSATAYSIRFCVKYTVQYTDGGYGEDFWASSSATAREARGAHLQVKHGANVLWDDFLGDSFGTGDPGLGCTDTFYSPSLGSHTLTLSSYGQVQDNDIEVYDVNNDLAEAVAAVSVTGSQTYNVTLNDADLTVEQLFHAYMTMAYALYRHAGGNTGQLFRVEVEDHSGYNGTFNVIRLGDSDHGDATHFKVVSVHEYGHRIADLATNDVMTNAQSYAAISGTDCPCEGQCSTSPHSLRSLEPIGGAAGEGFSHFYAADVWNNHDEDDCTFRYYKSLGGLSQTIDCEAGYTNFEIAYAETQCDEDDDNPSDVGRGVELDWLRAFWDLHTNSVTEPHFNEIVNDWLGGADPWNSSNAYTKLEARMTELELSNPQLYANWLAAVGGAEYNGIDH